jgi:large subunit ribosomal protein L17
MVTSLFEHGAIRTTDQKAKELRRLAAKMVTLGKRDSLHARRLAAKTLRSREVLVKLFDEIAPGYTERHGGYTRIIKIGRRRGDNAEMSLIELMPAGVPELKQRVRPVAPSVKAAAPASKEVFEETAEAAPADDATVLETAAIVEEPAAEEAVEVAAEEPAAEEPAAEEAVEAAAEEAPAEEATVLETPAIVEDMASASEDETKDEA